jgi:hypothetical protein
MTTSICAFCGRQDQRQDPSQDQRQDPSQDQSQDPSQDQTKGGLVMSDAALDYVGLGKPRTLTSVVCLDCLAKIPKVTHSHRLVEQYIPLNDSNAQYETLTFEVGHQANGKVLIHLGNSRTSLPFEVLDLMIPKVHHQDTVTYTLNLLSLVPDGFAIDHVMRKNAIYIVLDTTQGKIEYNLKISIKSSPPATTPFQTKLNVIQKASMNAKEYYVLDQPSEIYFSGEDYDHMNLTLKNSQGYVIQWNPEAFLTYIRPLVCKLVVKDLPLLIRDYIQQIKVPTGIKVFYKKNDSESTMLAATE